MSVPDPSPDETAILFGGPRDGMQIRAPFVGQPIIHTPEIRRAGLLGHLEYPLGKSTYTLEFGEGGWPSRDDAGRLRYRYTGSC